MELEKREYENLLALLHRVEIKGLAEAREVSVIAAKLEHKITSFTKPIAAPPAAQAAPSGNQFELFPPGKAE